MAAKKSSSSKQVHVVLSNPQPKKHVVRMDATDDDAAMSNGYITKRALDELGNPDKVRITIEAA